MPRPADHEFAAGFDPAGALPGNPGRCDFCTVRSQRLAGAMDFPLAQDLQLLSVEVQPVGQASMGMTLARTTVQAGTWGACVACAPVVSRRDPTDLAIHVLAEWAANGRLLTPGDLTSLTSLYRILLPALGPPTPALPEGVDLR